VAGCVCAQVAAGDPGDCVRHAHKGNRKEVGIAQRSQASTPMPLGYVRPADVGYRHSHRDLLKTAHTVVDMRSILGDVDLQYRQLAMFSPDLMKAHVRSAELYHQRSTSMGVW
jgi:hypothetical protein